MGNGAIALGDSLALLLWYLRLNLDVKDPYFTSVLVHPRQREGLRILERGYKEHINISVVYRGDTWGPKYNPTDESTGKVHVGRLNTGGYIIRDGMTLKKSVIVYQPPCRIMNNDSPLV